MGQENLTITISDLDSANWSAYVTTEWRDQQVMQLLPLPEITEAKIHRNYAPLLKTIKKPHWENDWANENIIWRINEKATRDALDADEKLDQERSEYQIIAVKKIQKQTAIKKISYQELYELPEAVQEALNHVPKKPNDIALKVETCKGKTLYIYQQHLPIYLTAEGEILGKKRKST